jgi:hypothetical protein
MEKSAVEWLEERLNISFKENITSLKGFFVIAKEQENEQKDEFAIGFSKWIIINCNHKNLEYLDLKKLLEIYKKEKGL